MPTCEYQRPWHKCEYDSDATTGDAFCLLHSPSPEKDEKAFEVALAAHRREKADIFVGFVFPAWFTFMDAEFSGEANFLNARFTKNADFGNATFAGEANFGNATFPEKADFLGAMFTGEAKFGNATFAGEAIFLGAMFTGEAKFLNARFTKNADFLIATFTEETIFRNADFTKKADFENAKFTKNADFENAKFAEKADFGGAMFTGEANFYHATFTEETIFRNADFTKNADFRDAKFTKNADFRDAKFAGEANFRGASFSGRTLFSSKEGISGSAQVFSGVDVGFTDVIIDPPDAIVFRDADLRKCRFLGTDLRKAEITNAIWPQIGSRAGVYDEIASLPEGETRQWSHIERVYRELKQNYEDRRDYERARDFHYGEKEMRRKNPEASRGLRLLLTMYWAVSGYGERLLRPMFWAAGLLAISSFCYLWWGLLRLKDTVPPIWEAILYSLKVMILLKPSNFELVGFWGDAINTLQSVLGPILIGLFALAIRQRLKR